MNQSLRANPPWLEQQSLDVGFCIPQHPHPRPFPLVGAWSSSSSSVYFVCAGGVGLFLPLHPHQREREACACAVGVGVVWGEQLVHDHVWLGVPLAVHQRQRACACALKCCGAQERADHPSLAMPHRPCLLFAFGMFVRVAGRGGLRENSLRTNL